MLIPKANFYLKVPTATEATLISLQIKFNGYRVNMSTGEKILPDKWDFVNHRGIGKENSDLNFWLNKISHEVETIFRNFNIDQIVPTQELVLTLLREKLSNTPVSATVVAQRLTFIKFIEKYVEDAKAVRKNETIKGYKTTINHLQNYSKLYCKAVDFDNIDMDFYYAFSDYLAKDLGNGKNTVAKHIKTIKTFLNEATDRGLNANMAFR